MNKKVLIIQLFFSPVKDDSLLNLSGKIRSVSQHTVSSDMADALFVKCQEGIRHVLRYIPVIGSGFLFPNTTHR